MSEENVSFSEEEVESCPEEGESGNFGKKWGAFKAVIEKAEIVKTATGETKRIDRVGNAFFRVNLTITYNNEEKDKNTFFGLNIYPKFVIGDDAKSLKEVLGLSINELLDVKNYKQKDVGIVIGATDSWGDKEEFEGKEVSEYKGNRFIRKGVLKFVPYKDVKKSWTIEDEKRESSLQERFKDGSLDKKSNPEEDKDFGEPETKNSW